MATKSTAKAAPAKKAKKAKRAAKGATREIRSWQDDPGSPDRDVQPVQSRAPDLAEGRLPIAIRERGPVPALYEMGTREFRYWAAAEALQRSGALWARLLPGGVTWQESNGRRLPVGLDEGEDLNAYYDRNGLHFFHANAAGRVVFSGESPDVCAHELGHAVWLPLGG